MLKTELRKEFLSRRRSLDEAKLNEFSKQICDRIFSEISFKRDSNVHIFLPIEKFCEVDTKFIIKRFQQDFPSVKIFVPRVNETAGIIESIELKSETKLKTSTWGIAEPNEGDVANPTIVDHVFVPLLCYDRNGNRVGYGKGFYDRFFAECRSDCVKIGLSYFSPVSEITDINKNDVKLDICVTPYEVYYF